MGIYEYLGTCTYECQRAILQLFLRNLRIVQVDLPEVFRSFMLNYLFINGLVHLFMLERIDIIKLKALLIVFSLKHKLQGLFIKNFNLGLQRASHCTQKHE